MSGRVCPDSGEVVPRWGRLGKVAVFLDRDGTINQEVGFVTDLSLLKILPRSAAGINVLNRLAVPVIVVTNQSGVARGCYDEEWVERVNEEMRRRLAREGAHVSAVYFCPHHPEFGDSTYRRECDCRKPKPGMVLRAAKDFDLDPARCYVVGDSLTDIQLGKTVGAKTALVLTGHGAEQLSGGAGGCETEPDVVVADLFEAATWVGNDLTAGQHVTAVTQPMAGKT